MKDVFLRQFLRQHGFADNHVRITGDQVVISNFRGRISRTRLNPEGALMPGTSDNHYHNYVYPEGLFPGYEQIQATRYPESHRYQGRVQNITVPQTLFRDFKPNQFVAMANLFDDATHTVRDDGAGNWVFTPDMAADKNEKLLNMLLDKLAPRMAYVDDFYGPNYVSDLGRLMPLIAVGAREQAARRLMGRETSIDLLQLRDELVDGAEAVSELRIDKAVFYRYLEKLAREEQLLARTVAHNLGMRKRNWIGVDADFFNRFERLGNDINAGKLRKSIAKKKPLAISTTTGGHAFAVFVDFEKNTIFLANPLGTYDGFNAVIDKLKQVTGCQNVVHSLTRQIQREGDIDFDDVCTADAVMLAHMLDQQHKRRELAEGSLNDKLLKTAHYLTNARPERDDDKYFLTGLTKVYKVLDELTALAKGNPAHEAVIHSLGTGFRNHLRAAEKGHESLTYTKLVLLSHIESAPLATLSAAEKSWGYWLKNLAIAVMSLGIAPIYTRITTGQWNTFRPESVWKLDELRDSTKDLDEHNDDSPAP